MEAVRYATLSGGKRIRPFLVMASSDLFGVSQALCLPCRRGDRDGALLFADP